MISKYRWIAAGLAVIVVILGFGLVETGCLAAETDTATFVVKGCVQPYAEIQVVDSRITANVSGLTPVLSQDKATVKVRSNSFCVVRIVPDAYIQTRTNGVMARADNDQGAIGYEVMVRSDYDHGGCSGYQPYCLPFLVLPYCTREISIGARSAGDYTANGSFARPGTYTGKLTIVASLVCH